jgi:hypothetical protein
MHGIATALTRASEISIRIIDRRSEARRPSGSTASASTQPPWPSTRAEREVAASFASSYPGSSSLESCPGGRSERFGIHGTQPAYLAELELWAVARTDRPLRDALISAERTARREIDRVSAKLFGELTECAAYEDVAALTQHFIRGLAISENVRPSAEQRKRLVSVWTEAMRLMLERGSEKRMRRRGRAK